jgi:hypothetical protein
MLIYIKMSTVFGAIGYTILKNINNEKKMLIFADMHDHLEKCKDSIIISEWLKKKILNKFNKNKLKSILILEEVPRNKESILKLRELWSTSLHTQELKNLYIENPNVIIAIDIRTYLIPFNLEIMKQNNNDYKIKLKNYLVDIDNFINKNFIKLYNNLPNNKKVKFTESKLGIHFNLIKTNYNNLLIKYNNVMDKLVTDIINTDLMHDVEKLLSDIMEFIVCVYITKNIDEKIIIHVGLAHSEKIIELLINLYEYDKIKEVGINKLNELNYKNINGCQLIDIDTHNQFGGE